MHAGPQGKPDARKRKSEMKILMLHSHYSDIGGAEVMVNHQIAKLRERGHEVFYFAFGEKGIDEKNLTVIQEPQSRFLRYFHQFFIHPRGYAKLKEVIKTFNPDIVHLHNIDKHCLTFLLPISHHKTFRTIYDFGIVCPCGWGVHKDDLKVCRQGIGLKCIKHGCIHPLLYPLYRYLFQMKHHIQKRRVHGYATATELLKKYMQQQGFKNISVFPYFPPERITVLTSSVPAKKILFLGLLEKHKGCESLIRAFCIAVGDIPDATLTIVGSGSEQAQLKHLTRSLNVDGKVRFVGNVPHREIKKYYLETSVVVVPSIGMENSPIVAYEALSFGKPVIATHRGGNPELIQNGYNGFLVEANDAKQIADALVKILHDDNRDLYGMLAANAVESSRRYDIDKFVDHLEKAYSEL